MINLANYLDLPFACACVVVFVILVYVILDGFDLGCGVICIFAPSKFHEEAIMNSIAPVWDGNETWLVMAGMFLFSAFPLAFSIIVPLLYSPLMIMLFALIGRGIALEFRLKSLFNQTFIWKLIFHISSLVVSFMQGVITGCILSGKMLNVEFSWFNLLSCISGITVVSLYALLGIGWLLFKNQNGVHSWIVYIARYVLGLYLLAILAFIYIHAKYPGHYQTILTILFVIIICAFLFYRALNNKTASIKAFLLVISFVIISFSYVIIHMYPWIVPFKYTIWSAKASDASQSLLLMSALFCMPFIIGYSLYVYYIFHKSDHESTKTYK